MNKICCIYTITNLMDNKVYVGYTTDFEYREYNHSNRIKANSHANEHLQYAVNKYGIENFKIEVLEECEERFLTALEHYWCTILDTHNRKFGYNIKPTHPDIINSKISQETKDKIRISNTGNKRTEESRVKMSISAKKVKRDNNSIIKWREGRQKVSKIRGTYHSEEGAKNISIAMSTRNISKETKNKMKKAKAKPILQYTKSGEYIREWECAADVHRELGISAGNISNVCCGRKPWKSAGGFIWKFK